MIRRLGCAGALTAAALMAQTARTSGPSYKDLKFPPLRQVTLPKVETVTLKNGMTVMLLENHELPTVRGVAVVRAGNLFDPADKVGLAEVTGIVMRSGGTKTKTGDQLDEQLENVAASVETNIGESYGTASFSALTKNVDDVLAVYKDVLTSPEFREDKVALAKTQLRSSIARRNDDVGSIANREFMSLVYGKDNSYGWDETYATVDKIQRADLVNFYKRYFFPKNIILGVIGDFKSAEMKASLEKLFADWTVEQPPVPAFPAVKKQANAGTFLITKTDVTQTTFMLGMLGGKMDDKDYPALEVMADILGGGFHSRLFEEVRTKAGYAYSVSAHWGAGYDHPGVFEISGSTKSQSTTDSLKLVKQELEKIRTKEVTPDELESARQTVLNGFVFNFDTPSKTLNRLLIYKYFGYPDDFLFRYQKAITAVTRADVLRVAREHIDPNALSVLAVGNPKDFGEPLTALGGTVKEIDITIPEPKTEVAEATPASLAAGKKLLARAQEAAGGTAKLAAIKDVMQRQHMEVDPAAGGLKADQTNRWIAPGTFRQDAKYPFGNVVVYYDGAGGWLSSPQGFAPLPDPVKKQLALEELRMWVPMLLADSQPGRKVTGVGENQVQIANEQGEAVTVTLDQSTGLPAKVEYQMPQGQGPPVAVMQEYSGLETVDGIKVPGKISITQNGHKFADVTVLETKFNSGISAEELKKRP